jgi:hypothetical protein
VADDGLSDRAKPPASCTVPLVCPNHNQIERGGHSKHRVLRRPFPDHHANRTRNVLLGKHTKLVGRACPSLLPFSLKDVDLGCCEIGGHFLRRRVKHGDFGIPRRGVVEVHSDQHA